MTRKFWLNWILVFSLLLGGLSAAEADMLASTGNQYSGYGYGNNYWDNMTTALNNACPNIDTASNFENLTQMLSYDALWLDARQTTSLLSTTELSNLSTFIGTGRRVVLMGENDNWTGWNNQILALGGGSYGSHYNGIASPVVDNELTNGVSTVYLPTAGRAVGGTALFDQNFATLWGDNVLTVLDINFFSDYYWTTEDNQVFAQNVANWVCASTVPLPGTVWLLSVGIAGLAVIRRKLSS